MKGVVFLGNRRCEVREVPTPEPGAGEVLIRMKATAICGSDLHTYRGAEQSDQIRGHEASGVVEQLGPGVVGLSRGDRVSSHHHLGCGACASCARGEVVTCLNKRIMGFTSPGSFGEYTVAPEGVCTRLPDSVSYVDGAFLGCVGTTAFAALRRLGASAYESLAVFGLGPVGLSSVILAKAIGLRVIGVDVLNERVEIALKCGADEAVNASETDPVESVRSFSRIPGIDYTDGVDYVIEASGSAEARSQIIPSLGHRRGAKAAILGIGSADKVMNPEDIFFKGVTLVGSVVFPVGWAWDLAKLLAASGISFEPAVTHRFPLDDAEEALATADEGRCGKVVLLPEQ